MASRSGSLRGIIAPPETPGSTEATYFGPGPPPIDAFATGSRHFVPFSGLIESHSWELLSVANLITSKQQAVNFLSFIRKRKAQFAVFNFGARDHAFVLAVFGISRPTDIVDAFAKRTSDIIIKRFHLVLCQFASKAGMEARSAKAEHGKPISRKIDQSEISEPGFQCRHGQIGPRRHKARAALVVPKRKQRFKFLIRGIHSVPQLEK